MFTGIIEKTARVIGVAKAPTFVRLTIAVDWPDVQDGESIAVNGVCLTVAERLPGEIGFDVVKETLRRTNLGLLNQSDSVHLERSLRVGDRISGHFVQGHVDGQAILVSQGAVGADEWRLALECSVDLAKYLTPKGSIAIDGVSLTIASITGNRFEVALIPTTLQRTMLGSREVGWPFNLEVDVLTKTVVFWLERYEQERGRPGNQV
jgi:riboflavin synthase alpha subunit